MYSETVVNSLSHSTDVTTPPRETSAVDMFNFQQVTDGVRVEMCMEMETNWITRVTCTWDSHGNGGDNDYITGMGMGIKVSEWE